MSGLWEELRNPQIFCKNDLIISCNYYKNVKCYKAHLNKWESWGSGRTGAHSKEGIRWSKNPALPAHTAVVPVQAMQRVTSGAGLSSKCRWDTFKCAFQEHFFYPFVRQTLKGSSQVATKLASHPSTLYNPHSFHLGNFSLITLRNHIP